jgi:hypothetical protein
MFTGEEPGYNETVNSGWWCGSSGKELFLQAQDPEFQLQYCQKKKKRKEISESY